MAAIFYECPRAYIESATDNCDQLVKVQLILDSLYDAAIKAATGEEVSEYSLDDGQTKIRSVSRSVDEISKSIERMLSLKNMLQKRINGHFVQLKDRNSLIF